MAHYLSKCKFIYFISLEHQSYWLIHHNSEGSAAVEGLK